MKKIFAVLGLLLLVGNSSQAQPKKVILAIFAHPDDEGTIGPVLAKYTAVGAKVYLAYTTDGRYGITEHAKIPKGDSLAKIRIEEAKCAAENLGAQPPIILGLHDQLGVPDGFSAFHTSLNTIKKKVIELFVTLKPDVVITWGPSGWTGHPDHRLIGAIVTEVFASKVWGQPANLFYPELVTGSLSARSVLTTMNSSYLPVKIPLAKVDYDKATISQNCHKSQYTMEQATKLRQGTWYTQGGVIYFRPFIWKKALQTSLFE